MPYRGYMSKTLVQHCGQGDAGSVLETAILVRQNSVSLNPV